MQNLHVYCPLTVAHLNCFFVDILRSCDRLLPDHVRVRRAANAVAWANFDHLPHGFRLHLQHTGETLIFYPHKACPNTVLIVRIATLTAV